MSLITDVAIVAITNESAAITALNAWCAERHDGQQLTEISADGAGGHKVPSMRLYAAAFNYLHLTEFETAVRAAQWRLPSSVIVYIDHEGEDDTFVMSPARPGRWSPAKGETGTSRSPTSASTRQGSSDMAREQQRAAQPRHLDAHIVPAEKALIARATALEEQSAKTDGGNTLYMFLAAEFRSLAAELKHW